jgi:hypothetical protein
MMNSYSDLDVLKEKILEMKRSNINSIVYGQIDEKEATKMRGAVLAIDAILEMCKQILKEKEMAFEGLATNNVKPDTSTLIINSKHTHSPSFPSW